MKEKLLSLKEVSETLGLKLTTLYQWSSYNKHLPFVKVGKCVKVREQDLLDFIERGEIKPQIKSEEKPEKKQGTSTLGYSIMILKCEIRKINTWINLTGDDPKPHIDILYGIEKAIEILTEEEKMKGEYLKDKNIKL